MIYKIFAERVAQHVRPRSARELLSAMFDVLLDRLNERAWHPAFHFCIEHHRIAITVQSLISHETICVTTGPTVQQQISAESKIYLLTRWTHCVTKWLRYMTKPKLTELAKARVDREMKRNLQMLGFVFRHQDESDTVREALADFIEKNRSRLPQRMSAPAH